MAIRRQQRREAYGMDGGLLFMAPEPIVAQRAPTTQDFAEIGTTWVDSPNDAVYVLTSIRSDSATWSTSPASGVGTFTSVTVNPGDITVTAGNVDITAGDLNLAAGNATIAGDLSVAGTLSFTGDLDLSSAALIDLTSTLNAAPAILLRTAGGASEQIRLHATMGTSVNSIELDSDVGGITLVSNLASADAINLSAPVGGVDIDGALQVNIASSQNAANAIVINASNGAGGLELQAGSAGILIGNQADCAVIDVGDVVPTSARTITVGGGAVATAIADTIDIAPDGATTNAGASKVVNINSGALDTATLTTNIGSGNVASGTHAVNVSSGTGTKSVNIGNADGLTTVNIDAITLINDSLNVATSINTGTSTGTISIGNAAAGAITLDSGAGISLDGAAASNVSVSGAGIDLTLASAAGRVVVNGEEAADDAVRVVSAAGGIDIDAALSINITSSENTADSIVVESSAGGIDILASGAAAGEDIDITATGSSVNITSTEATADAIVLNASDAAGGIDLLTGGGEISISSAGNVTMVPDTASVASPTASSTQNFNVIVATFTGFTTAMGASQDFTITSSEIAATSGILVQVTNLDASTNGALMTLDGVTQAAGSIVVSTTNNGAGALGAGDNVLITVWVIS